MGGDVRVAQRVADVGDDVAVLQLLDGEVDAHRHGRARAELVEHPPRVAAALAQHPAADRHDQARVLGKRDELVG